jgi:hypothetical protein
VSFAARDGTGKASGRCASDKSLHREYIQPELGLGVSVAGERGCGRQGTHL